MAPKNLQFARILLFAIKLTPNEQQKWILHTKSKNATEVNMRLNNHCDWTPCVQAGQQYTSDTDKYSVHEHSRHRKQRKRDKNWLETEECEWRLTSAHNTTLSWLMPARNATSSQAPQHWDCTAVSSHASRLAAVKRLNGTMLKITPISCCTSTISSCNIDVRTVTLQVCKSIDA